MKFYCDIKRAMKIEGVRFKPIPKSRKKILKINRRARRSFEKRIEEDAANFVSFKHYRDPVTQLPILKREWKTSDGSTHTSYEVCNILQAKQSFMRNTSRDNHAWRTPDSIPNIVGYKLYVMTNQGAWEETEVVMEGRMHRLRGFNVKDVKCWKPRQ